MDARPTADRSVRLAWVADAPAIAHLQIRALHADYATLLPADTLATMDAGAVADTWSAALRRPPSARHRVLVALDRATVVGFAALAPAGDPDSDPVSDAELVALHVDPDHRGVGHGSRLLQAAVDTAHADRCTRLTAWLFAADHTMLQFLRAAGWEPDAAHREVASGADAPPLSQLRVHTAVPG